jgi:uncharacterized protein
MLETTGLYAAALTLLYLFLTGRVIAFRRAHRINLGDGDNEGMLRRMRAHGNFAEYAPLGLLLLGIAELQGRPNWALHILGAMLLVGRVIHGLNFTLSLKSMLMRTGGMLLTILALALGAVLVLPI